MVDGLRKIEGTENGETIEAHVLAETIVDRETDEAGAVAIGRISH
jgi:hypothetical protein